MTSNRFIRLCNECADCRYYIPLGEKTGYCGNSRVGRATTAARSCWLYEPRAAPNDKAADGDKSRR